jgi:hypothetical protein
MLALAGTLAACSTDSTGPNGSVTGTYTLRRINGQTLPYTFPSGRQLISDRLTLYSDGTYEDVSQYSNAASTFDEGDFTNENGAITFYSTSQEVYQGSVSGNLLTQILNSYTQVFERE